MSHAMTSLCSFAGLLWLGIGGSNPLSASPITEASTLSETVILTSESADRLTLSFTSPAIEREKVVSNSGQFDLISIPAEPTTSRPGWPDLPMVVRTILMPPTGGVELQVHQLKSHIETDLLPAPAPAPEEDDYQNAVYSRSISSHNGFWPPNPIEIGRPAILRGYRLLPIRIYPVQFNSSTGETKFNDNIDFSLSFGGTGENEVQNPDKPRPSLFVRDLIGGMVVNPPPLRRDGLLSGSYLYIVPNVNGVDDAIQPLLDWRKRMGHRVLVVHVANNAAAGTILNIIQDAYNSDDPVEFVGFIGDAASSNIIVPPATQTGDYAYTRLDGNDPLPDIALGRITVADLNQLQWVISKIVSYESSPYMDATDWFKRGAVVAGHQGNGIGEVFLARWVRKELLEYGFDEVLHWYWNEDGEISGNQPFLTNTFRTGISILHYRAFSHMNSLPLRVITELPNTNGRWPAVLAISCNTGNFVSDQNGEYNNIGMSEEFFRARGGGIGAIGTATSNTNVKFNNLVAGGVWLGVYCNEAHCLGWGLVSGKYQIWRAYDNFDNRYMDFMDWNNLMGDPGTAIWTGIPKRLQVDYSRAITLGETRFDVEVSDADDGVSLKGAQICLWKEDELHAVRITDSNGEAHFDLPSGSLTAGVMKLTVVKHNVRPFLADVAVTEPQTLLGLVNWTIDDDGHGGSSGNGNGIVEAGERIEIALEIANLGENNLQGEAVLTAASLSEWAQVVGDPIVLDEPPGVGESVQAIITCQIDASCPDRDTLNFSIDISSGGETWKAMAVVEPRAPKMKILRFIFEEDGIERGEVRYINAEFRNIGGRPLRRGTAELISNTPMIVPVKPNAEFGPTAAGATSRMLDLPFRIRAHPSTTPGTVVDLTIAIEDESGFRDTTTAFITIGSPARQDPFGPDYYGYICYDSDDSSWADKPDYNWVEVSGDGSRLNLNDQSDNQDCSVVVGLPFEFRYYGVNFDHITVCSNGWAAFGAQSELAVFRNQHIGQALCPNAMLCPWWDNLIVPNNAGVFTRYDQQQGRFTIEWNNVQRLVEGGGGSRETFEIILYTQQAKPTITGDGVIDFLYRDIDNQNALAHNDIPFCTIGITGLDGSNGLEYTYWNQYPAGATTIRDQMAVRFTTGSPFVVGTVEGTVTDYATGAPIEGAQVISSNGFWGETDRNGFYRISDIVVGRNYSFSASRLGWNDSTRSGFDVREGEELQINFNLYHPEFESSIDNANRDVAAGDSVSIEFTITNNGNGSLVWRSERRIAGVEEKAPWELLQSLNAGAITGDDRIEGCIFVDDKFYASGANGAAPNVVYIFNRDGELIDEWRQQGYSNYGMKDLEWDGEWLWGGEDDTLFAYNLNGEVMTHWRGPGNPSNLIAWDSDRGLLWIASTTRQIEAYTRNGERTGRVIRRDPQWRMYGLTYNPEDPTGKCLYILSRPANTDRWAMFRVNPDNGESEEFNELFPPNGGSTSGISMTTTYDPLAWVMLANANNPPGAGGDRVDVYYVQPRTEWMRLNPDAGTVNPGDDVELTLYIRALNLPPGEYQGELLLRHNASGGSAILPVVMRVQQAPGGEDLRPWILARGWNQASLNLIPIDDDVPTMMAPLVEAGVLVLMKDGFGRFYRPAQGFNNIPAFDPANGYQLYLNAAANINLIGIVIAPDEPLPLNSGWNLISYYPRIPLNPEIGLNNLGDLLIIAKDAWGRFYIPAYHFNNMNDWREGQGYQVKVTEQCDLIYNVGERLAAETTPSPRLTHFSSIDEPGPPNFSLLVLGDPNQDGWELAALSKDGIIVGAGRFDEFGRCGLAVWGGGDGRVGLSEGDGINARVWDGIIERDVDLGIIEGALNWTADGIAVARLNDAATTPLSFGLDKAYPNPFNSQINLRYGVTELGLVRLVVHDLNGREAAVIVNSSQAAGRHSIVWKADDLPSGVYIIRLQSGGESQSIKIALIR